MLDKYIHFILVHCHFSAAVGTCEEHALNALQNWALKKYVDPKRDDVEGD